MSQNESTSPFGCSFCRESLEPAPILPTDVPRLILLTRPYRCPHCFQCFFRPFGFLMAIPGLNWLIRKVMQRLGMKPRVRQSQPNPPPESDSIAPEVRSQAPAL